jgi:hypothetical protein
MEAESYHVGCVTYEAGQYTDFFHITGHVLLTSNISCLRDILLV